MLTPEILYKGIISLEVFKKEIEYYHQKVFVEAPLKKK